MKRTTTYPVALSATTLIGDAVKNLSGRELGRLEELMIDIETGRIAYAVLSFGGVMGAGDKLFAIPWGKVVVDPRDRSLVIDVSEQQLENADGFDKDHWPDFGEESFHTTTYGYWNETPYWAQ